MEDRAPDTELHLEHTTDSAGCDKSESEEATDTEDSSGIEELVDSSVRHQGGEEQSDVQSGSDTVVVGEGKREVGESKRGRIKQKVKRQQFAKRVKEKEEEEEEEEEEEVEEEGLSRCRISRRGRLLQRRSLQRKMKLSGSRKHRTLIHT